MPHDDDLFGDDDDLFGDDFDSLDAMKEAEEGDDEFDVDNPDFGSFGEDEDYDGDY